MKELMNDILNRLKSPVVWLAIIGLVYNTILLPNIKGLPSWTSIFGFLTIILGVTNNPTDKGKF